MLIIDSNKAAQRRLRNAVDRTREITAQASRKELHAENVTNAVTNPFHQHGRALKADVFMSKLRKLNPNLVLEPHPNRHLPLHADKACLYLLVGDQKVFLMACEGTIMPEWSVMETREVKDMFGGVRKVPGREISRGWRTILIRLLQKGLVTLEAVEREFGAGDRQSWKVLTAKGPGTLVI